MTTLHNIEAEQALLGALMIQNEVLDRLGWLHPEHFFDPVHQRIFHAVRGRIAEGHLASPTTMIPFLRNDPGLGELGGTNYLARLAGAAVSVTAAPHHAAQIRDLAARRQLDGALDLARQKLDDAGLSPSEVISTLDAELCDIAMQTFPKPLIHSWQRVTSSAMKAADEAYRDDGPKVRTGLAALDELIGGLRPGRVYTLAGRPSMGKTSVAAVIADNVADNAGVLWASLEMDDAEVGTRALSRRLAMAGRRVPYASIERGQLSVDDFRAMLEVAIETENRPILTVDESCSELPKLEMAIRHAEKALEKRGMPLGLIVLDYLQLLRLPGFRPGFETVSGASKAVKRLAMRHNVPVVSLSQLSREVESRDDKRPRLSDLRQSGEIEEDSSVVMMCYRDAYYLERDLTNEMTDAARSELVAAIAACRDRLEISVLKNRSGAIGTAHLHCDLPVNIVSDLVPQESEF